MGAEKCFLQHARHFCNSVLIDNYNNFHSFWDKVDNRIPQIFVPYEMFSNHSQAPQLIEHTLNFLNETRFDKNSTLKKAMSDIIVEPNYRHGSLFARMCGKEKARRLHLRTNATTEKLGYIFDDESASWSLLQTTNK